MKLFTYILTAIAIALIFYNFTKINIKDPFNTESIIAAITMFASLCVILLLSILRISKRISELEKRKL
jgi:FtsH-binding integral membrane protein